MKKLLFFTIVPAWLCSSTALAEPLSQSDKDYVVLGLGAVRVITECPDYRGIPDAIRKLVNQIGVDPAVVSAVGQVVRMKACEGLRLVMETDERAFKSAGRHSERGTGAVCAPSAPM
jgi:hypothetical protein